MNILIIGATGGTGRELVQQALDAGHKVTALVRKPSKVRTQHQNLTVVKGNVLDYDAVDFSMRGMHAVISALGHKQWLIKTNILSEGTKNIIASMEKHGVKRFICETSLGVGESKWRFGLYHTLFVIPFIIYFYFRDKELQERYIKESSLDWTIVRPGQLTSGRMRGVYRHGTDIGSWIFTSWISRADVADFMLKQLSDETYLHMAPGLAH